MQNQYYLTSLSGLSEWQVFEKKKKISCRKIIGKSDKVRRYNACLNSRRKMPKLRDSASFKYNMSIDLQAQRPIA